MTKVAYPSNTCAWLVTCTTVENPVEQKWRIKILSATFNKDRNIVEATFMWKGQHCTFRYGWIWNALGSLLRKDMALRLSAKYERELYIESMCKLACDPTSETYKSM